MVALLSHSLLKVTTLIDRLSLVLRSMNKFI